MFGLRKERKSRIGLGLEHLERRDLFSVDGLTEPLHAEVDLVDETSAEIAEFSAIGQRDDLVQPGEDAVSGPRLIAEITDDPNVQSGHTTLFAVRNETDSGYKVRWGVAWYDGPGTTTLYAVINGGGSAADVNQLWGDWFFIDPVAQSIDGSYDGAWSFLVDVPEASGGEGPGQNNSLVWSPGFPPLSAIFTDGFESGNTAAWSVRVAAEDSTPAFHTVHELANRPIFADGFESGDTSVWR